MVAVVGPSALWYTTRGTGLVAMLLLTATMVMGILTNQRWSRPSWPRFANTELHRSLSLMCVMFLGVHIVTAELDPFAPVGWPAVLLPFLSSYRPLWLGLGTVAFDLLIALVATSLVRQRVGFQWWRTLHWAAYMCWPVALIHALGTGSDARLHWVDLLYAACTLAVLAALAVRLANHWERAPGVRLAAAGTAVLGLAVTGHWAAGGPLAPGWATKAGTPSSLLLHKASAATSAGAGSTQAGSGSAAGVGVGVGGSSGGSSLPASFTDSFSGTVSQGGGGEDSAVTVVIAGQDSGQAPGTLRISLSGQSADGGVALQSGTLALTAGGTTLTGPVTGLSGNDISGRLVAGGVAYNISVQLQIDPAGATATGTVSASQAG